MARTRPLSVFPGNAAARAGTSAMNAARVESRTCPVIGACIIVTPAVAIGAPRPVVRGLYGTGVGGTIDSGILDAFAGTGLAVESTRGGELSAGACGIAATVGEATSTAAGTLLVAGGSVRGIVRGASTRRVGGGRGTGAGGGNVIGTNVTRSTELIVGDTPMIRSDVIAASAAANSAAVIVMDTPKSRQRAAGSCPASSQRVMCVELMDRTRGR